MKTRKLAALSAAIAMTASMAVPAMSNAETSYSPVLVTDSTKTSTTLDKYLVMDKDANVPNAEFTFAISKPGAKVDATATTLAVLPGVGSPVLTNSGTMTFSPSDTTVLESTTDDSTPIVFTTDDKSDEKYVNKTLTLDFANVQFTEPGVYRYYITESGTNQGVTNGYVDDSTTETVRTLDVYVEDANSTVTSGENAGKPQLKITGYVMYNGKQTGAPKKKATGSVDAVPNGAEVANATKNNTITNTYASQDLTFGKEVTGNQGSKDKYFDFTVTISGATAGTVYTVDISKADATSGSNAATIDANQGKTNATSITVGSDGTATTHFYLQDGQYITILGLAKNTVYTVDESEEDYSKSDTIKKSDSSLNWDGTEGFDALTDAVSGTIADADIHTGFTNDRSGDIPTGILSTVGGSAALAVVGIAGIAGGAMYLRKKKSEED